MKILLKFFIYTFYLAGLLFLVGSPPHPIEALSVIPATLPFFPFYESIGSAHWLTFIIAFVVSAVIGFYALMVRSKVEAFGCIGLSGLPMVVWVIRVIL